MAAIVAALVLPTARKIPLDRIQPFEFADDIHIVDICPGKGQINALGAKDPAIGVEAEIVDGKVLFSTNLVGYRFQLAFILARKSIFRASSRSHSMDGRK